MRAVRLYGVGDLRVEEVPRPAAPSGSDVLLKVLAAGICGSDLHNFRTGQWISRAPSTPGHELAGEVLAVGTSVAGFAPGDRVVADSRFWCGACPACVSGRAEPLRKARLCRRGLRRRFRRGGDPARKAAPQDRPDARSGHRGDGGAARRGAACGQPAGSRRQARRCSCSAAGRSADCAPSSWRAEAIASCWWSGTRRGWSASRRSAAGLR